MNTLYVRKKIEVLLPQWLSTPLINNIRSIRKHTRMFQRSMKYGKKSFIKNITTGGVSFRIFINPYQNGTVDTVIAQTGLWEEKLSTSLKKHLTPESYFIDIGANIGYHTLFAASILTKGHVFAIEPQPRLCNQIKKSLDSNNFKNITIINKALGDKNDTLKLYIRDENIGSSSIGDNSNIGMCDVSSTELVSVARLDDIMCKVPRIDVIKIDIEGYEFEALTGARSLLKKFHPAIFLELSPMFYESDYHGKTEAFINFLVELEYSFYDLEDKKFDPIAWFKVGGRTQIDIIAK